MGLLACGTDDMCLIGCGTYGLGLGCVSHGKGARGAGADGVVAVGMRGRCMSGN